MADVELYPDRLQPRHPLVLPAGEVCEGQAELVRLVGEERAGVGGDGEDPAVRLHLLLHLLSGLHQLGRKQPHLLNKTCFFPQNNKNEFLLPQRDRPSKLTR